MSDRGAEVHRAVYRFSGLDDEMEATLPLGGRESLLCAGAVSDVRRFGLVTMPLYLRLSSDRLCLLEHFLFRSDRVVEARREQVGDVTLSSRRLVELSIDTVAGRRKFRLGRSRLLVTPRLRLDAEGVRDALTHWLSSP